MPTRDRCPRLVGVPDAGQTDCVTGSSPYHCGNGLQPRSRLVEILSHLYSIEIPSVRCILGYAMTSRLPR